MKENHIYISCTGVGEWGGGMGVGGVGVGVGVGGGEWWLGLGAPLWHDAPPAAAFRALLHRYSDDNETR